MTLRKNKQIKSVTITSSAGGGKKAVGKGLLERRSMRPIMNKFIVMAEQAGFLDINDWLETLTQKRK